jgi:amino acid permease
MLFVTDSLGDVVEAQGQSISTVAVTWGVHSCEIFTVSNADNLFQIVDSIPDLAIAIESFYSAR